MASRTTTCDPQRGAGDEMLTWLLFANGGAFYLAGQEVSSWVHPEHRFSMQTEAIAGYFAADRWDLLFNVLVLASLVANPEHASPVPAA